MLGEEQSMQQDTQIARCPRAWKILTFTVYKSTLVVIKLVSVKKSCKILKLKLNASEQNRIVISWKYTGKILVCRINSICRHIKLNLLINMSTLLTAF